MRRLIDHIICIIVIYTFGASIDQRIESFIDSIESIEEVEALTVGVDCEVL